MNTYEIRVSERFRQESNIFRAREKKLLTALNTRDEHAILRFSHSTFSSPLITSSMIVLLRNAFLNVTGVPRYYRMLRMTKDDGRYSLTSQSHLSRERWSEESESKRRRLPFSLQTSSEIFRCRRSHSHVCSLVKTVVTSLRDKATDVRDGTRILWQYRGKRYNGERMPFRISPIGLA